MPPVQAHTDHCQTAQDVLMAAQAVRDRRRQWAAPIARPAPIVPKVNPEPAKVIQADIAGTDFPTTGGPGSAVFVNVMSSSSPEIVLAPQRPSIKAVQIAVCNACDVTMEDLLSDRRMKGFVRARHISMALCRRLTGRSFPEIGRRFGGRDHTTVLHGVEKMEPVMAELEPAISANTPLYQLALLACQAFDQIQPTWPRRAA